MVQRVTQPGALRQPGGLHADEGHRAALERAQAVVEWPRSIQRNPLNAWGVRRLIGNPETVETNTTGESLGESYIDTRHRERR
jgi:hypothetical protein